MSKSQLLKGALLCFIAAVAWGAMFPVAESALHHLDPFWFSTLRYVTVTLLLVLLLLWKEGRAAFRLDGKGFRLWIFGTFAFTIYNFGVFWGQQQLGKSGVLLASIMESFMPMLVVLLMWFLTRKRPNFGTLTCVIVAFVGVLCVVTKGNLSMFGSSDFKVMPLLSIFAAVISWVLYTVGSGQFKGFSALRYSTLTCLLGSITSLVIVSIATLFGQLQMPTSTEIVPVLPEMAFMVLAAGLLALLSWLKGIELLSPVNGMLFINFVPATTFVISVLQGYSVSVAEWIGTALIVGALIVNNIISRRPAVDAAPNGQAAKVKSRPSVA
ncbi:DMT family transporter [Paenibacillus taiwanensis]|uniref:DMT family transporter n=1 Tax=Paenibacillus taiwanensis TaxID=401638 RepID=UPI0003F686C0|nr:DMT family transporter [Paenibacillus taiwanensis]